MHSPFPHVVILRPVVGRRISLLPCGFYSIDNPTKGRRPEVGGVGRLKDLHLPLFSFQRAFDPRPEGLSHPQHDSHASKRVLPISTRLLYHLFTLLSRTPEVRVVL